MQDENSGAPNRESVQEQQTSFHPRQKSPSIHTELVDPTSEGGRSSHGTAGLPSITIKEEQTNAGPPASGPLTVRLKQNRSDPASALGQAKHRD